MRDEKAIRSSEISPAIPHGCFKAWQRSPPDSTAPTRLRDWCERARADCSPDSVGRVGDRISRAQLDHHIVIRTLQFFQAANRIVDAAGRIGES